MAFEGEADDAQIMDESLFEQLKAGFSEDIDYSYELTKANVIWTDELDDSEWPQQAEQAQEFWVVLIDYHY